MPSRIFEAFRDDWRVTVAAVLGLGLLAALLTVVVVLISRPGGDAAGEGATAGDAASPTAPAGSRPLPSVTLEDFRVPNEGQRLENWWWERYRTPGKQWTEDQIDRFWEDPVEAGLDYLEARNDEEMERILENVP